MGEKQLTRLKNQRNGGNKTLNYLAGRKLETDSITKNM